MSLKKVIIFGATGAVGSAAALEAHKRGAQVYLAMRDTKKPTPILPDTLERVQADLSDPVSIEKAVKETGATAAFIYVIHGTDMKPAAEALKKAGIQHVVLLSSYTVYPDRQTALTDTLISKVHAEAEIALEEVGVKHTDIRPMYFTSNLWQFKHMIQSGEVFYYGPDSMDDYIAPEDIGSVAGVKLLSNEAEIIPLTGPKLISKSDGWKIAREELGLDFKITSVSAEHFIASLAQAGFPTGIAQVLVKLTDRPVSVKYPDDLYKTGAGNVQKYTGREPIGLQDWLKKHKEEVK